MAIPEVFPGVERNADPYRLACGAAMRVRKSSTIRNKRSGLGLLVPRSDRGQRRFSANSAISLRRRKLTGGGATSSHEVRLRVDDRQSLTGQERSYRTAPYCVHSLAFRVGALLGFAWQEATGYLLNSAHRRNDPTNGPAELLLEGRWRPRHCTARRSRAVASASGDWLAPEHTVSAIHRHCRCVALRPKGDRIR